MRQLYSSNYTGIPAYLMDFGFGGFLGYGKGVPVGLVMEELNSLCTSRVPIYKIRFIFLPKSNFPYCASKVKCCGSHTESLENTAYSRNTDAVALF